MTCRTWWFTASAMFLFGMIMGLVSHLLEDAASSVYFALLNVGFAVAGWVLWGVGLVSYIRGR